MKISIHEVATWETVKSHYLPTITAVVVFAALATIRTFAQSPPLLWSTNIGATLFAVDADTNLYANAGGSVIKLNAAGIPLQTNLICPLSGLAKRDAAGNYYFAGLMPGANLGSVGPQDFGGIVLSNKPVYVVKYSPGGTLLWATNVGPSVLKGAVFQSFAIDELGNALVGYGYGLSSQFNYTEMVHVDVNGSESWKKQIASSLANVRITPCASTNFYVLAFPSFSPFWSVLSQENGTGVGTTISYQVTSSFLYSEIIPSSTSDFYTVEGVPGSSSGSLTRRSSAGALRWSTTAAIVQRTVGPDQYDGVHVASDPGTLSRYDSDGNLAWTRLLPANCLGLLLGPDNNRFLSMSGGIVGRLGDETLVGPVITNAPAGRVVFAGTNVTLSVGASGTTPLRYYWLSNGVPLAGKTNAPLSFTNASPTQTANYSVIVSNLVGAVTSTPVSLTIKGVAIFFGSRMLTNGTYNFLTPPTLTIANAFTNGSRFYTLDGSAPTFASTFYTTPFLVSTSATVRALGYSADFSQYEEADPVNIVLPPSFPLTLTSTPGGSVALNPPGGTYLSNQVVTLSATPTNGWSFLYWQGDAMGASASANVTMNGPKSVHAVFGSTISTTVSGNGQVQVYPPGGIYPYGSVIRLTGIPEAGSYFGVWGNAASGMANPLYFTVTNANPTISSLFPTLSVNQAALTVLINGPGMIQVTPAGNVFSTLLSVNITATPLAGQGFINWSGDATGSQNPVSVAMTQSRTVTANFTNWPVLLANQQSITPQGFRLTVLSGTGLVYQIQGSANLGTWVNLGVVTNASGQSQFTDPAGTNLPLRFYRGTPWP